MFQIYGLNGHDIVLYSKGTWIAEKRWNTCTYIQIILTEYFLGLFLDPFGAK